MEYNVTFTEEDSFNVEHTSVDSYTAEYGTVTQIEVVKDPYSGKTEFEPNREVQVAHTNGCSMYSDIVIKPIPKNYGLITYNGATITVS